MTTGLAGKVKAPGEQDEGLRSYEYSEHRSLREDVDEIAGREEELVRHSADDQDDNQYRQESKFSNKTEKRARCRPALFTDCLRRWHSHRLKRSFCVGPFHSGDHFSLCPVI